MRSRGRSLPEGFTLVEIIIATGLSAIVLAALIATSLQLARSGVRINQYSEMQGQIRRALDRFGVDARMATAVKWNSSTDLTLTVPNLGGTTSLVTYAWTGATQSFYLVPGADSTTNSGRVYLVQGVAAQANGSPGLTFSRFDRDGHVAADDPATKRILVSLAVSRQSRSLATSSENTVVASFTLRNKAVK